MSGEKKSSETVKEDAVEKREEFEDRIELSEIAKIAAQKPVLFAIQKLRKGPIRLSTFEKFLKARFSHLKIDPDAIINMLVEKGFVKIFEVGEKLTENISEDSVNRPVNHNKYLCLIKDYMAIRKPPLQIYDLLEQGILPEKIIKEYRKRLEAFFKEYSKSKSLGDDPEVIGIYMREEMVILIDLLSKSIFPLKEPPKQLINVFGGMEKYLKAIEELAEKDFVYLAENPKNKGNPWVILLTDIDLQQIFPEYLINGIAEQLKNEIIDKDVAIIALNILKNSYVKSEKPKLYVKITEKITKEIEMYNQAIDNGDRKSALKSLTSIINMYNSIGEYEKVKEWQKKLDEFQNKN